MQLTASNGTAWCAIAALAAVTAAQLNARTAETDALKAYHAELRARASVVWNRLAPRAERRVSVGTVKIRFDVAPDGRIHDVRIASNTGNRALAELAIRTIRETRIPPIPRRVAINLADGRMPAESDFTVYPSQ